ncbi:MAG: hypothetical protein WCT32_05105 [Patescibacteria group bacterium]|jgi:D-alanine--D-alanine ligase
MQNIFKIALICGGPSLERGISLNSARSVMDNLEDDNIEIVPFYLDQQRRAYRLSKPQLYSNTPSDFDFKLSRTAKPLSQISFIRRLRECDIAFPVMHGTYGEDGGIQRFLEKNSIPFVGSDSTSCKQVFDKFNAHQLLGDLDFKVMPTALLKIYHHDHKQIIDKFFEANKIKHAVVKPASGGSSMGVFPVSNTIEALERANYLFSKRIDTRVVLEPFAEGIEFTTIVLENRFGQPVAILPTEIEADYAEHQIFDFRKKYLPTRHVTYHCPPRFPNKLIEQIQIQAEQIFSATKMSDFARFDGWVLSDGSIWFSDLNPISGMEQHSFLFQQASRVGLSHRGVLRHIVKSACRRQSIDFPERQPQAKTRRREINILFGGNTSERQVSLLSGTNAWLKLLQSKKYLPKPYLLDRENNVWQLPYSLVLNHTVEEIATNCSKFSKSERRLRYLENRVRFRLGLSPESSDAPLFAPQKLSLKNFIKNSSFVFNALHGGEGENGILQQQFEKLGTKYNGPDATVSNLCADKALTLEAVKASGIPGIHTANYITVSTDELIHFDNFGLSNYWKKILKDLKADSVVIKPKSDGCSSGVAHLFNHKDLANYIRAIRENWPSIPKGTLPHQLNDIEMPTEQPHDFLIEEYVTTDKISVRNNKLNYQRRRGWIEVTIGVIEKDNEIIALNPSLTVASGEILSVEEKFQGGTGINITPPPKEIISQKAINRTKELIGKLSNRLGIKGYSRIDAFLQVDRGDLIIIEINTLPALTPSTVLFHQALAEEKPLYPRELLEQIISSAGY